MKQISVNDIGKLFAKIAETKTLYLPVEIGGQVNYGPWSEEAKVRLDALKTVQSPKGVFFPQVESMIFFNVNGKNINIRPVDVMNEDFVLFGVRACDVRGFEILDRVFLSEPKDALYAARRAHGIIVTMACNEPEATCFCTNFGIDPADPKGDVTCWKVDEKYILRANTEKGEALIESLEESNGEGVEAKQTEIRAILEKLPYAKLNMKNFDGEHLMERFSDAKWAELSKACLGCGTCTFVCPTCQCYNIKDYDEGKEIARYRCWDSCMYSDFTLMAAGTPRPTQLERFRQRFMHKLVYFPANNEGIYGCVGCGRCLEKCPQHLHIVKVIKALEVKDE